MADEPLSKFQLYQLNANWGYTKSCDRSNDGFLVSSNDVLARDSNGILEASERHGRTMYSTSHTATYRERDVTGALHGYTMRINKITVYEEQLYESKNVAWSFYQNGKLVKQTVPPSDDFIKNCNARLDQIKINAPLLKKSSSVFDRIRNDFGMLDPNETYKHLAKPVSA